jgi:hypothetical protein
MRIRGIQMNSAFKPIIKIAVAAAIAGVVVFATTLAPRANSLVGMGAQPQTSIKGDRLMLALKGAACSTHGWPDFERSCQFDLRTSANEGQKVRIISLR